MNWKEYGSGSGLTWVISPAWAWKNCGEPRRTSVGSAVSGSRSEPETLQRGSKSANHSTATFDRSNGMMFITDFTSCNQLLFIQCDSLARKPKHSSITFLIFVLFPMKIDMYVAKQGLPRANAEHGPLQHPSTFVCESAIWRRHVLMWHR
jgi:hypothetical protein